MTNGTLSYSAFKHVVKSSTKNLLCVHHFFILLTLTAMLALNGCTVIPTSVVKQPSTARATPVPPPSASTGAIYNSRSYRAMFQDRKPRGVGDIVTINIVETTAAKKTGASSGAKKGVINTAVTSLFGMAFPKAKVDVNGSSSYEDAVDENASNTFTGSLTTTVTEVLPNGYFVVSGEKQISLDKGTEFVRFSGVVNPDNITLGNMVNSLFVADARIEYRTAAKMDAAQIANTLSRFFLSVSGL